MIVLTGCQWGGTFCLILPTVTSEANKNHHCVLDQTPSVEEGSVQPLKKGEDKLYPTLQKALLDTAATLERRGPVSPGGSPGCCAVELPSIFWWSMKGAGPHILTVPSSEALAIMDGTCGFQLTQLTVRVCPVSSAIGSSLRLCQM